MARFNRLCEEMLREWLGEEKEFYRIFHSSLGSFSIADFHTLCDQSNPTVTLFYTSNGSMFGGYTTRNWDPEDRFKGGWKQDTKAFLFSLYEGRRFCPDTYPVKNPKFAIYCHYKYGPTFGGKTDSEFKDIETKNVYETYRTPGDISHYLVSQYLSVISVTTALGVTYGTDNIDSGCFEERVTGVEVYQVLDKVQYVKEAWRKAPDVSVESLKNELELFQPSNKRVGYVNILVVGQIGSGKSSYLNAVFSAFRGYVTSPVCCGSATHSLTSKNEEYKVFIGSERKLLNFRFWDTKGLEWGTYGPLTDEIIHIIKGRPPSMMDNFCSWLSSLWHGKGKKTDRENIQDEVHCVAFVIDGSVMNVLSSDIMNAFNNIKKVANHRGIPQVVLLTKVDKVCPMVGKRLSLTFHSKAVHKFVDETAELMGLPRTHVCPIRNYEQECELDEDVDKLVLLSLRQMLRFADDYLCKFM